MASGQSEQPRQSSRKSWFDAPHLTSLRSPMNVEKDAPHQTPHALTKRRSIDPVENLTLTHFTAPPRINFGAVVLGRSKVRTLCIRNPHDYEQEVIVERFPFKKKFIVDATRFIVQPLEIFNLEITWTPEDVGGVREMILFHVNDVYRLQTILFGAAENPKPARKKRKPGIRPKVKQPFNVVQTHALNNIKTSYSPKHNTEAEDLHEYDENARVMAADKENLSKNLHATETICHDLKQQDCVLTQKQQRLSVSTDTTMSIQTGKNVQRDLSNNFKALMSPTPLESTTIVRQEKEPAVFEGQRARKQWKGIADSTAKILNTMSPIPLSEGNENGITVDSYYQPNEMSVLKQSKVELSSTAMKMKETFAIPQPPFSSNTSQINKVSVHAVPSRTFTSGVGQLLQPELNAKETLKSQAVETLKSDRSVLPGDATYKLSSPPDIRCLQENEEPQTTCYTPIQNHDNPGEESPYTRTAEKGNANHFTQASPNTMLNESLSFISGMKILNQSNGSDNSFTTATEGVGNSDTSPGSSSPNISLSCSIIAQGQGLVSPDSFLEDMRNASLNCGIKSSRETNNTSTPATPSRPNKFLKCLKGVKSSLNSSVNASTSGTPCKQFPCGTRSGTGVRRSFTSQYQKQEAKTVAAAIKAVKNDKDTLHGVSSPFKLRSHPSSSASRKNVYTKGSGESTKMRAKRKSPYKTKNQPKRLILEQKRSKERSKRADQRKESIMENDISDCTTPKSKQVSNNSGTVVKSRSLGSEIDTNNRKGEVQKPRYFPDILTSDISDKIDDQEFQSKFSQLVAQHKPEVNLQKCEGHEFEILHIKDTLTNDLANLPNKNFDRCVTAVERALSQSSPSSSPHKFVPISPANLPASPSSFSLTEEGRRGTLTVTKSHPSDALLASMNNRKRLFDHTQQHGSVSDIEGGTEMQENVEVVVEESYQERDGQFFVIVKETTNVTKSVTDTFIEEVTSMTPGVSPCQFTTPIGLPNSPNLELSRQSTHIVHSPRVLDKSALTAKELEFTVGSMTSVKEIEAHNLHQVDSLSADHESHLPHKTDMDSNASLSTIVENELSVVLDSDKMNENTQSDDFEREVSACVEVSGSSCTVKSKSDTFDKEASAFLEVPDISRTISGQSFISQSQSPGLENSSEIVSPAVCIHLNEIKDNQLPITAVCIMSPRLVDYEIEDNKSCDDNASSDSLNVTTQSEDSLDKSCNRSKVDAAKTTQLLGVSESGSIDNIHLNNLQGVELGTAEYNPLEQATTFEIRDETNSSQVNKKCETEGHVNAAVPAIVVGVERESDDLSLHEPVCNSDEEDHFYDTLSQRYYDALSDTINADLDEDVQEAEHTVERIEVDSRKEQGSCLIKETVLLAQPAINSNNAEYLLLYPAVSIDHREEFLTTFREVLHVKTEKVFEQPREEISKMNNSTDCQKKHRRSLSADHLLKPVPFSVEISEPKKSSTEWVSRKPNAAKVDLSTQPKSDNFVKPSVETKLTKSKCHTASEMRHRSQSLSNLQKASDKKCTKVLVNKPSLKNNSKPVNKPKKLQKGIAQSKLILTKKSKSGAPRHPMPFASRNMYYDERWIEKQERGFVQWLNFVLTPPDEYLVTPNTPKVNASSLSMDSQQSIAQLAPSKEVLSFRSYAARRRLNRLRRQACEIYQSSPVVAVIRKVEIEVESRRLAMRKDKMAHADLGIKQRLLDLLLQYSSLWLRVGLETVFGEVLMLQSNQDVVGLSRFIVTRLLASPDIASEYAHPTVPHLYRDGYAAAVARHTLKKFLLLVFFLDYAKTSRLIDHDPCLFCKDAHIKSSKEILVQFSREVLSGVGDITRHLAYLGYTVSQTQRPLDEFDFAVKNLSSDLRDGVRLCRVLEFMTTDVCLMGRLRAPAISRLQKIHNVEVFFKAAELQGMHLTGSESNPKDVVDGHREKTLALLWRLILHFQSSIHVNEKQLKEEIDLLTKSLRLKLAMQRIGAARVEDCKASRDSGAGETKLMMENTRLQLIFQWCRLVCLHYGVKVDNFTVSFSDGRALCCLLHHYHPALLPLNNIKFRTSVSLLEAAVEKEEEGREANADISMDWGAASGGLLPDANDPEIFEELLTNEKSNFKVLYEKVSTLGGVPLMLRCADMSNTIPDEKVVSTYVAYLCARLLDIGQEVKAARVLQLAWRRRILRLAVKERQKRTAAAIKIQCWMRPFLEEGIKKRKVAAAVKLQTMARGWLARREVQRRKDLLLEEERHARELEAVLLLQRQWRGRVARLDVQRRRQEIIMAQAAVLIQKMWRGKLARVQVTALQVQLCQENAAIVLQKYWRGKLGRQNVQRIRLQLLREKNESAAIVIQAAVRCFVSHKKYLQHRSACILIQSWWRTVLAVRHMKSLKTLRDNEAAVAISKCMKGFVMRKRFLAIKKAAMVIQSLWRMKTAQRELNRLKQVKVEESVICVQKFVKGFIQIQKYRHLKKATILLQSAWRAKVARQKLALLRSEQQHKASVIIQKNFRAYLTLKKYCALKVSVVTVQKYWRVFLAKKQVDIMKQERRSFAAVTLQKHLKAHKLRSKFLTLKKATITAQKIWRGVLARRQAFLLRQQKRESAAIIVQKYIRGYQKRSQYLSIKNAALVLQKIWRGVQAKRTVARMIEEKQEHAAVVLQKHYRMFRVYSKFQSLKHATVTLQKNWRRIRALRLAATLRNEKQAKAAVSIQKVWRGFTVRKNFACERMAALCIQSFWRMVLVSRMYKKKKTSVLAIQLWWRINIRAKQEKEKFLRLKKAAICLQRAWQCKYQQREFFRLKRAAVVIQAAFRCFRRRIKFVALRLACVVIQRRYRAVMAGQQMRKDYLKQVHAATIIQRRFRANQKLLYIKRTAAALVMQTIWRKVRAERLFTLQKYSAVVIQRRFREHCLTKANREDFLQKKYAILTMQRTYRAHIIKKRYNKMIHTIVRLQSFVRTRQAQKSFRRKKIAIITLQRKYRAARLGRVFRQAYLLIRSSAVTIQRFFRAKQERRRIQNEVENKRRAAFRIQALYRGWKQKCTYIKLKRAAICVQSQYRAMKKCKETREKYTNMKSAAITLQRWWRGYMVIKMAQRELAMRKAEWQRKEEEKRKLIETWLESTRREHAACLIQRSWRGFLVMQDYVSRENAAVVIQTWVRGYLARLKYAKTLTSVILLQTEMKAWFLKRQFQTYRLAAIIIQRRWRETLNARKELLHYNCMKNLTIKIQAIVRMKLQHKAYVNEVKQITLVQACVRQCLQKSKFRTLKSKAIFLQRKIRAHHLMKREKASYLRLKHSAIKIQSIVRSWLACRKLQQLKAAVKIQAWWRMHQHRAAFLQAYEAAQVLKFFMQMKQQQQAEVKAQNRAACIIQQTFRLFMFRRQTKKHKAASVIQDWFRAIQARQTERKNAAARVIVQTIRDIITKKKMQQQRSATKLQSVVRMYLERRRYLTLRRSAVLLQAALRGCKARELASILRTRHHAATKIQAAARGFTVRKKFRPILEEKRKAAQEQRRLHSAATKMQALWKGYKVRRDNKNKKLYQTRRRLEKINRSATEDKTLGSRTSSALDYLLHEKDLAYILESLMCLDTSTRLSPVCCQRMVEVNAVGVLYRLVNSCNRSLPHMDLIKYSISILLNLAKYEKTVASVAEPQESVSTLLDLMQIYRDKGGAIFLRCCNLMGILGLAPATREAVVTHPGITDRLQAIHALVQRKHRATQIRQMTLIKMAASRSIGYNSNYSSHNSTLSLLTPSKLTPNKPRQQKQRQIRPGWSLAQDAVQEFEEPLTAITFVLSVLGISPKAKV